MPNLFDRTYRVITRQFNWFASLLIANTFISGFLASLHTRLSPFLMLSGWAGRLSLGIVSGTLLFWVIVGATFVSTLTFASLIVKYDKKRIKPPTGKLFAEAKDRFTLASRPFAEVFAIWWLTHFFLTFTSWYLTYVWETHVPKITLIKWIAASAVVIFLLEKSRNLFAAMPIAVFQESQTWDKPLLQGNQIAHQQTYTTRALGGEFLLLWLFVPALTLLLSSLWSVEWNLLIEGWATKTLLLTTFFILWSFTAVVWALFISLHMTPSKSNTTIPTHVNEKEASIKHASEESHPSVKK